jgi:single-stranded-DNA-specific exonuclease
VEQVRTLKARGMDVLVTDHHLPGDQLPDCIVVNPKVSAPASLEWLCGAGVAFLLSMELVNEARERGVYRGPKIGGPLIVLAGLATVTDIMPLSGQNRLLVAEALKRFRTLAPVGLRELYDRATRSAAPLTSRDFGFLIGPRVNAAGRLASGMEALSLLLAKDREEARALARTVDFRNTERKTVEQSMTDAALQQVVPEAPAQVIDIPDGHQGVAGIVAARILERLGAAGPVPVCVVVRGHGSARAPDGYNLRDAFVESSEALTRFGGHAAAGGFSVRDGQVARFRELFCAACARQAAASPASRRGAVMVDAVVDGADITLDLANWLGLLEPYGEGNPTPVFAIRRAYISEARPLGQDGRHLQVAFRGLRTPRGVWWNRGDIVEELRARSSEPFDVAFTVEVSTYGEPHPELRLVALCPSSHASPETA